MIRAVSFSTFRTFIPNYLSLFGNRAPSLLLELRLVSLPMKCPSTTTVSSSCLMLDIPNLKTLKFSGNVKSSVASLISRACKKTVARAVYGSAVAFSSDSTILRAVRVALVF